MMINKWPLFWLLTALASAVEALAWVTIDPDSAPDCELLIRFNWRLAAPYFLAVFFASPLQRLRPNGMSRWLMVNRRYIGLAFAAVCALQLVAIGWLAVRFPGNLREIHENSIMYVEDAILAGVGAMALTSFDRIRRHMSAASWNRIHRTGTCSLGVLYTANYVAAAIYLPDPRNLVLAGLFAFAWILRGEALWKRRSSSLSGRPLSWVLVSVITAVTLVRWAFHEVGSGSELDAMALLCERLGAVCLLGAFSGLPFRQVGQGGSGGWLMENSRFFFWGFVAASAWGAVFAAARVIGSDTWGNISAAASPRSELVVSGLLAAMTLSVAASLCGPVRRSIGESLANFVYSAGVCSISAIVVYRLLIGPADWIAGSLLVAFAAGLTLRLWSLARRIPVKSIG